MREMKDSGISWVGEIPKEWSVNRAKYCFVNTKEIAGCRSDRYERLALTMNGVIKRSKDDSNGLQPEKFETYQILRPDELVFKLIDLQNVSTSRVGLSPYLGLVSPAYIILKSNRRVLPAFAEKYFLMLWKNQIFNALGDAGVRSNLNSKDLLELYIPFPSLVEQQKIAEFLDRECGKIDGLKADIQAQIDTLEQYKRSVITEAVTHGLNPSAPMKDSGIPWVGKIPAKWAVLPIYCVYGERKRKNVFGTEQNLLSLSYGKEDKINHYCKKITTKYVDFPKDSVRFLLCNIDLKPWDGWTFVDKVTKDGKNIVTSQNPSWWRNHNQIKHSRTSFDGGKQNYKKANQNNVINALAALFQVEMYFYNLLADNENLERKTPLPKSKLFSIPRWTDTVIDGNEILFTVQGTTMNIETK